MTSNETAVAPEPVVERLLREQGRKKRWLAGQLGMARTTLDGRITGDTPWTLAEALRLADIFRVAVTDFAATDACGELAEPYAEPKPGAGGGE